MKDWLAELGSKWMKECDGQLSLALAMRDQAQHLLQLLVEPYVRFKKEAAPEPKKRKKDMAAAFAPDDELLCAEAASDDLLDENTNDSGGASSSTAASSSRSMFSAGATGDETSSKKKKKQIKQAAPEQKFKPAAPCGPTCKCGYDKRVQEILMLNGFNPDDFFQELVIWACLGRVRGNVILLIGEPGSGKSYYVSMIISTNSPNLNSTYTHHNRYILTAPIELILEDLAFKAPSSLDGTFLTEPLGHDPLKKCFCFDEITTALISKLWGKGTALVASPCRRDSSKLIALSLCGFRHT